MIKAPTMFRYLVKVQDWYSDEVDYVEVYTVNREKAVQVALEMSSIYWGYVADYDEDVLRLS